MALTYRKQNRTIMTIGICVILVIVGVVAAYTAVSTSHTVSAADFTPTDEVHFTFDSGTGTITDYDGVNGPDGVVIPETIGGVAVTAIDASTYSDGAYSGSFANKGLTSVVIPNSVVSIGDSAFIGNPLESVVVGTADYEGPATLSISSNFYSVPTLTSVTLGNNVIALTNGAFYDTSIEELFIPNSVGNISTGALDGNLELRILQIGTFDYEGEATVDICASLSSLPKLEELRIGNTVRTVGCGAISYNPMLHTIIFGNGMESIKSGAINNLPSLRNVDLGESIEIISEAAFYNTGLEELFIPDSVKELKYGAFSADSSSGNQLKSITFGSEDYSGTPMIDLESAFSGSGGLDKLETIVINGGVKTVGASFFSTPALNSLTIRGSVEGITVAFADNQLTEVFIPDSVQSIDGSAFMDGQITKITIAGDTDITGGAFTGNVQNTGEYIRLYTLDPTNPYGYTDTADFIVNPVTLRVDYVDKNGGVLAPSWFGVGDTLTDYTIAANPDGDFTQYYRYGDIKTISAPSLSGYVTPPMQAFTLGQGANIAPMVYGVPAAVSVPGAPNTGVAGTADTGALWAAVSGGLIALLMGAVVYRKMQAK